MDEQEAIRQVLCNIARSAFEVVNRLLARDQLLAQGMRSEATTSRQIYREECITVEMAATLRERFPENVEITLFTAPEEARTGADWYWRFERGNSAIHARVQAKRVQRNEFGEDDNLGNVDINLLQLSKLINATTEANEQIPRLQAWVATFARFEAVPPCGRANPCRDCLRHHHAVECERHEPSLWIAAANEIQKIRKPLLSVRDVVKHSVRLDCVLPCTIGPSEGDNHGPEVKGFTLETGLLEYQECVKRIQSNSSLLPEFAGAMCIRA